MKRPDTALCINATIMGKGHATTREYWLEMTPSLADYNCLMELEELEQECDIEFTRTGGPGGQHRNKAETAVRITHRPTGIVVVASESRSQYRNRITALERLSERLEELERERDAAERRRRRRRTKPTLASRLRRLEEKKRLSRKKLLRRRVKPPSD